jgi:hypothetical protein
MDLGLSFRTATQAFFQCMKVLSRAAKALGQKAKGTVYDFEFLSSGVVAAHVQFGTSVDQAANFFHFRVSHNKLLQQTNAQSQSRSMANTT